MSRIERPTIGVAEAARRLKVKRQRVLVLLKDGRIPGAYKSGRDWHIPAKFTVTPALFGPKPKVVLK